MSEYAIKAALLFREGYNCAQSVAGAFAEHFEISLEIITKLASSFGGGVAGRREMCGAVSGMLIVIGLGKGDYPPNAAAEKQAHYALCRVAIEKFEERLGTAICARRLEYNKSGKYGVDSCGKVCEIAADIAAEILGLK